MSSNEQYTAVVAEWEQSKQSLARAQEVERHLRMKIISLSPRLIDEGEKNTYDRLPDGRTLVASSAKRYIIVTQPAIFSAVYNDLPPQWRDAIRVKYEINKTQYRELPDTAKQRLAVHLDVRQSMVGLKIRDAEEW